ncbi:MAG: hypothetical protein AAFX10_17685 [Pseudomonadota bacterium]
MRNILSAIFLGSLLVSAAADARDMPDYYSESEEHETGRIDDVRLQEHSVVINDVQYTLSDDVVVHSLESYSVSRARLRPGIYIAYKLGSGRRITNVWLLPASYDPNRRR